MRKRPGARVEVSNVKHLREEIPLTKSALARRAEITEETIARMERGQPTRRDSRLKVAKALGKPLAEVFPDEDSNQERHEGHAKLTVDNRGATK